MVLSKNYRENKIQLRSLLLLMMLALSLTGCNQDSAYEDSYFTKSGYQNRLTRWLKPYKIDVQQGNLITSDMLNEVKIGMNKQQVKHLLGTSVLSESDSKDQWVYAFTEATNGKLEKEQLLVLSFKNNRLNDIKENTVVN